MICVIYAAFGVLALKLTAGNYIDSVTGVVSMLERSQERLPDAIPPSIYIEPEETSVSTEETKETEETAAPVDPEPEINGYEIKSPNVGEQYGMFEIERLGISAPLFFGDGTVPLYYGVGQYTGSYFPGFGEWTLIAGHNNTYFHTIGDLVEGDIVRISTHYGVFEYKVTYTVLAKDSSEYREAYAHTSDREEIIFYTCYPFNMLGLTPQRYFVHAEKISGPRIVFK